MPILHINPNENQYGIRNGWVLSSTLTGLDVGTNDIIVEMLLKDYKQDEARAIKLNAANEPFYFLLSEATITQDVVLFTTNITPHRFNCQFYSGGALLDNLLVQLSPIFNKTLHIVYFANAANCYVFCNGHLVRTTNKINHNWTNAIRIIRMFNSSTVGGVSTPSIGCMLRYYNMNGGTFTSTDILNIHRKYLRTPFITPPELLAYEAFRFTGRQPDGSQILAADTNVYNEAPGAAGYGEALAIQGGLTWGGIRSAVHV